MTLEIAKLPPLQEFELNQRRAKAYAESGWWEGMKLAQALVKIEAGASLGIPPLLAMNEVHVIDGKPGLGAGACAALVRASGRYDYRIVELTPDKCVIRFYDRGEQLRPDSEFTIEDARTAQLLNKGNWTQYPRNMLFARAMTNGMAWHCPDVAMGRIYIPDELGAEDVEEFPWHDQAAAVEQEIVEQLDAHQVEAEP